MERDFLRHNSPPLSPFRFEKAVRILEESGDENLADAIRKRGMKAVPSVVANLNSKSNWKLADLLQETVSGQRSLLRYSYRLTPTEFMILLLFFLERAPFRKFALKSTALQKVTCILKGAHEKFVPFDDFAAYEFGPFSVELERTERQLRRLGFVAHSEEGELVLSRTGKAKAHITLGRLGQAEVAEFEATACDLARVTLLDLKQKAQKVFIEKWPNISDTYLFPQVFFCSIFRKQIRLPDAFREILPTLKGLENVSQINPGLRRKLLFGYSVWAHTFDVYCSVEFLGMKLDENDKNHLRIAALLHDSLKRFNPAFEPVIKQVVGVSHEEAVRPFLKHHFGERICSNYSVEKISDIITGRNKPYGSLLNSDILDLDQITYTLELSYLLSDRVFHRNVAQNLIKNLALQNGNVCLHEKHLDLCEKWYSAYVEDYVQAYLSREAIADTAVLRQALNLAYSYRLLPVPTSVDDLYGLHDDKILESLRNIESSTSEAKIVRSLMATYDHDRRFGIVEIKQKITPRELNERILDLSRKLDVESAYIMTFPLAEEKMLSPIPIVSNEGQIVDAAQLSRRIRESRNRAKSKLTDVVYFVVPWRVKDQIRPAIINSFAS